MLHPQAVAAIEIWAQEPGPGDPGFDITRIREHAREAAAAEPREDVERVEEVDADGVPARLYRPTVPAASAGVPPATTPSGWSRGEGVVVFLHGGGFVFGDLDTHDAQARRIANRTGMAVFAVEYRRPPEHPFPAAPIDVDTALAWLVVNGPGLGLDLARLVSLGDSAGGNLALVAALRNPNLFAATVLVYPFIDPQMRFPSYEEENRGLLAAEAAWYWQQYLGEPGDLQQPDFGPLDSTALGTLPPTLVVAAEHDVLRDEDVELVRRITKAGGSAELSTYPGMIHGFWRHPQLFDAAEESLSEIAGFLRDHLP